MSHIASCFRTKMEKSRRNSLSSVFLLLLVAFQARSDTDDPLPTLWPERFHALLYMNLSSSGKLQITDLWYDWPKGRNLNLMQKQLGVLLHDVEWNNGTSYYFTLGAGGTCQVRHFEVGIPRQDWLAGSTYLGQRYTDGFLCHVWEKVDFIWYYEDVNTHIPVRWDFYDGISTHVMTFEVGAELEDSEWQAPPYCFTGSDAQWKDRNGEGGSNDSGLRDNSLRKLVTLSSE